MERKHTTIYIEENEEITSIVERIKRTPASEIALVVPRRSFLTQSIVNLKILRSQSEKTGKKLMLVTRDGLCRSLAEKVGLNTDKKLDTETLKKTQVDTLAPPKEEMRDVEPKVEMEMDSREAELQPQPQPQPEVRIQEEMRPVPSVESSRTSKPMQPPKPEPGPGPRFSIDGAVPSRDQEPMRPSVDIQRPPRGSTTDLRSHSTAEISQPPEQMVEKQLAMEAPTPTSWKEKTSQKGRQALEQVVQWRAGVVGRARQLWPKVQGKIAGLSQFRPRSRKAEPEEPMPAFTQKPIYDGKEKPVLQKNVGVRSEYGKRIATLLSKKRDRHLPKVIFLPQSNARTLVIFLVILLVVFFWVGMWALPRSEVKINAVKEEVSANFVIKAALNQEELDKEGRVMPARLIEQEVTKEVEEEATGEANEQAGNEGKITGSLVIFNEFSASPEVLIENTRFATESGLVFRSLEAVRIPGYAKENGKIEAGEASVEVVAEEEGEEYAIGEEEQLTIPGLKGDERYDQIYARPAESFTAEADTARRTVTSADIKKGRERVEELLRKEALTTIQEEHQDLEIVKESMQLGKTSLETDRPAGSRVRNFKTQGTVLIKVMAFEKKDLEEAVNYLLAQEDNLGGRHVVGTEIEIIGTRIDSGNQVAKVETKADQQVEANIDGEALKEGILGLTKKEAQDYLRNQASVEDAEIKNWPFWVRKIPDDSDRVKLSNY